MQRVCSPDCAQSLAKKKREKIERANDQQKLEAMKPRKHWIALLKKVMHFWVRLRDEGKPCISCDTILVKIGKVGGDYDAGHYRSVGSAKHLEFDGERNIHGQCKRCNDHLGGNYAEYSKRLPARIGQEAFEALECDQNSRSDTIDDLKELIAVYRAKTKQLKKEAS